MFRTRLPALLSFILLAGLVPGPARADPLADLAKYSVFPSVDLSSLSGGSVQALRGPTLGNPRDVSIQAVYLIHAPVARALQMHQQWDAGKHSELKVYLHHDFSTHPTLADFSQSIPGNAAVRKLTDATKKLPDLTDLQLSKAEAATFKNTGGGGAYPPAIQSFWSQILFHRATAFLSRGLSSQPPYESPDGSSRASEEVSRLLAEQPKVRAAFAPIIGHSPLGGGIGSAPLLPYWELFDVEDQAAFNLGAAASVLNGDSAQMVDLQYFASGGYFAYITLYQMWPITVAGKPATLVWRVDSMSSQALSDLPPFDRMASSAAMRQDILRIINFFQKDTGR